MDSDDASSSSDTSSDGPDLKNLVMAAVLLVRIKARLATQPPVTCPTLSDEPIPPRSVGQSSKRSSREHSVSSPIKKKSSKSPSLDDCLYDLTDIIKELREQKSRRTTEEKSHRTTEAEEMARVNKILKEDGYNESDLFFAQALNVCTNRLHRRAFLDLETKEGRFNYVKACWDVMTLKAK